MSLRDAMGIPEPAAAPDDKAAAYDRILADPDYAFAFMGRTGVRHGISVAQAGKRFLTRLNPAADAPMLRAAETLSPPQYEPAPEQRRQMRKLRLLEAFLDFLDDDHA